MWEKSGATNVNRDDNILTFGQFSWRFPESYARSPVPESSVRSLVPGVQCPAAACSLRRLALAPNDRECSISVVDLFSSVSSFSPLSSVAWQGVCQHTLKYQCHPKLLVSSTITSVIRNYKCHPKLLMSSEITNVIRKSDRCRKKRLLSDSDFCPKPLIRLTDRCRCRTDVAQSLTWIPT